MFLKYKNKKAANHLAILFLLETTARPCRANVRGRQCLTGAALWGIFVLCLSIAVCTHYLPAKKSMYTLFHHFK